jgi:hypothetical protein
MRSKITKLESNRSKTNGISYQVALNRVLSYKGIYTSWRGLAWRGYVQ